MTGPGTATALFTTLMPREQSADISLVRARWLKPSLVEVFFLAVMLAAFGRPQSWQSLISDGDCGWHIRTGDLILKTRAVPHTDPFSFSRVGQPWFAWEWLSEVIFSLLHRWGGLAAVASFTVVLVCF